MIPAAIINDLYYDFARRHNYEEGCYSRVWDLGDGTVLKISDRDKGALKYLNVALKNQHNPHFPVIKHLVGSSTYSLVGRSQPAQIFCIMERLIPARSYFTDDFCAGRDLVPFYGDAACEAQNPYTYLRNAIAYQYDDEIDEWFSIMREHFPVNTWDYDLHSGNTMVRSDGTLVVTDPVCGPGNIRETKPCKMTQEDKQIMLEVATKLAA